MIFPSTELMQSLFDDLAQFLDKVAGTTAKDGLDAYVTEGRLIPSFKKEGDGMVVCHFRYVAVFEIERLDYQKIQPSDIYCRIISWISRNDPDRLAKKLAAGPELEVDAYQDENLADYSFNLEFIEPIYAMRDPDGTFEYNGEWWAVNPVTVDVAENVNVTPADT